MLKVMTVVGTRPEIIRLSRVIAKLDVCAAHCLVHTGQNFDYELNQVFFEELQIRKPDHFLNSVGSGVAETIGNIIAQSDRIMEKEAPDAVLVLGDTNSCLAVIAAKRRKIPIFHMEAGNRCFDARVPEETNRKIVDHLADINLPYSAISRENLIREGFSSDRIIKTGSPMFEVLNHYKRGIASSGAHEKLGLREQKYVLVSCHREENVDTDRQIKKFVGLINSIAARLVMPVIVSTHPRTRKRIEITGVSFHEHIRLLKPLGFFDYVHLQQEAYVVVSDSGTISEESSILNFPAVNIREAHERPEAMEEGSVIMTGFNIERVFQALDIVRGQGRGEKRILGPVDDYMVPNVSEKIVRIIHSYTDFVNQVVWRVG